MSARLKRPKVTEKQRLALRAAEKRHRVAKNRKGLCVYHGCHELAGPGRKYCPLHCTREGRNPNANHSV
jgi:hypothetical protein